MPSRSPESSALTFDVLPDEYIKLLRGLTASAALEFYAREASKSENGNPGVFRIRKLKLGENGEPQKDEHGKFIVDGEIWEVTQSQPMRMILNHFEKKFALSKGNVAKVLVPFTGEGSMVTEKTSNETRKESRQLAAAALSYNAVEGYVDGVFDDVTQKNLIEPLLQRIQESEDGKTNLDIVPFFRDTAMEMIYTTIARENNLNTYQKRLVKVAFDMWSEYLGASFNPNIPQEEKDAIKVRALAKIQEMNDVIYGLIDNYPVNINEKYKTVEALVMKQLNGEEVEEKMEVAVYDLFSALGLWRKNVLEGKTVEDQKVESARIRQIERNIAANLFFGGLETLANGIGIVAYFLSQHPEIMEEGRKEVRAVLEQNKQVTLRAADLKEMAFVKQIVKEALRMIPPLHSLKRTSEEDLELDNVTIPANRDIVISVQDMLHDPSTYQNPGDFDPHRWDEGKVTDQMEKDYLIYGFGPRMCIGAQLAQAVMEYVTAELLRNFEFSLQNPKWKLDPRNPKTSTTNEVPTLPVTITRAA